MRKAKADRSLESVRAILLHEWDPIGVGHHPACIDEYDRYARRIGEYLEEGIDEFGLRNYLAHVQIVVMGLSSADEGRDRAIARRLMALSK